MEIKRVQARLKYFQGANRASFIAAAPNGRRVGHANNVQKWHSDSSCTSSSLVEIDI